LAVILIKATAHGGPKKNKFNRWEKEEVLFESGKSLRPKKKEIGEKRIETGDLPVAPDRDQKRLNKGGGGMCWGTRG